MPRLKQDSSYRILDYVVAIFDMWGKDWHKCELCRKRITGQRGELHHTKYEGATIYDLLIVCHGCNMKEPNLRLV